MAEQSVIWAPQPGPQTWAITCPCEDLLFGGARGGGKSDYLMGDWTAHAGKYGKHARGLLLRRTTQELEEIVSRAQELLPPLGARYHKTRRVWTMPDGARLRLNYLEHDDDATQYQGHQYTWVAIDEAGQFPNEGPLKKLIACLRSAHGVPCYLRMTANPGGKGHAWLKRRYMPAGRPPMTPWVDPETKMRRVFIPSRVSDNRILLDSDPGYIDRLRGTGPTWLVKAWLEGDWDVQPSGGVFDVDKVNFGRPPAHMRLYMGGDTALTKAAKKYGDESAFALGGVQGQPAQWWILHLDHFKASADLVVDRVFDLWRAWNPLATWIEGGPAGQAVLPWLERQMRERGTFRALEAMSHMRDKVSKAAAFSAACNSGALWVPEGAAWWPHLRDQMITFDGEDGRPDDAIDACGVLFRAVRDILEGKPPPEPPKPPPPRSPRWFRERRQQQRQDEGPQPTFARPGRGIR